MAKFPTDVFTEPDPDPDTLANLGPLRPLAGTWRSEKGADSHPVLGGDETNDYVETYDLQPIDAQTNGPQLFYGLRYHIHITKPGEVETFHDQVGYWLFEPATNDVLLTIAIPRGQTALAMGSARPDDREFDLVAFAGSRTNGICSNPFLEYGFRTVEYRIHVTANNDGTWGYEQDTMMEVVDTKELTHHTDRNVLTKIAEPTPNPLAQG